MTSLILAITLAVQTVNVSSKIVPPLDVQKKVIPILDLCEKAEAAHGEQQNAASYQAAKLVGGLFDLQTKSSDEALVVLMGFYIGEAPQRDLLHEVSVRGKRMLPLLLKYRDASVIFSKRDYPPSVLVSPKVKRESFDRAIRSVKSGKIIRED